MSHDARLRFFRNLVAAASVDGEIGDEERVLLASYGKHLGVDEGEFLGAVALAVSGKLKLVMPTDPEERGWMLEALTRIAHADGKVAPRERGMLTAWARKMWLSEEELERCLKGPKGGGDE